MPLFFNPFKQSNPGPVRHNRRATDKPPTVARIRKMYERPASFTNLLPWLDYDPQSQAFLLADGRSVGALFELRAVSTEARPARYLADLRDKLQTAIAQSIPEEAPDPWIVQFFLQDESAGLARLADEIARYAKDRAKGSALTEAYLAELRAHLADVGRPGGLFVDEAVTGAGWRGKRRRIRAALYRLRRTPAPARYGAHIAPEIELNDVATKFVSALSAAGVQARRATGEDLYAWLFRWFNPHPPETGGDTDALLEIAPYPGDDEEKPYGYDLSEVLMRGMPHSDKDTGLWWFDGVAHKTVTVQGLNRIPEIGLISAERAIGEHVFTVFDRAPEDTVLALTIVIQAQDEVVNHLNRIRRAAVGDYAEAQLAAQDADKALMEVAKGNKLFPMQWAFFLRGGTERDLSAKLNGLNSLLQAHHIVPIRERDDLIAQDAYIRNLPMNYEWEHDRRRSKRARLTFAKHIANLLPLYGRSTGTGRPGVLFFNRGGEPLLFDPLDPADRKKNGHALIIGPTGSGKSATLVYLVLHMLALYRPRVFIIEAGNSFGLLGQYLKSRGVRVNQLSLAPSADVSLPPFAEALKLLEQPRLDLTLSSEKDLNDDPYDDYEDDPDEEDSDRDLLGEMEIAARLMITGGEAKEEARFIRPDRHLIQQALLEAAKAVKAAGRSQVLPEDVAGALRRLEGLEGRPRERAHEMAANMELFCSGLAGRFFNRPGTPWPDVDVTLFNMGILAREGYGDQLAVAYVGLMNHIHALVERFQHDGRPTLVVTDEGHIITTNPLLSPYVVKIVKMWRKFGAWFWIATQNMEDFPDASRRMLNMLEWWLCLAMPKDEADQIARFKSLTDEQRAMLLAARKAPGRYTEGVALTDEMAALFRVVPPALALALAMTEKEEKAARRALMRKHGCSELDAALRMAGQIAEKRRTTC